MPSEIFINTYGELAQNLDCSISNVKKLWYKYGFDLEHRLGCNGRIKMTQEEFKKFKKNIKEKNRIVK